jgi:general stress protein 26
MGTHTQDFREILTHFDTAMLVSHEPDGHLRARPMNVAEVLHDGELWFVTSLESQKTREVADNPQVAAVMQGGGRYLVVSGRARIVMDPARIERVWKESWRPWFPDGPKDPRLCLIHVDPQEAEYWDTTGVRGLRFAFQAAKAYVTGHRIEDERRAGGHGRMTF